MVESEEATLLDVPSSSSYGNHQKSPTRLLLQQQQLQLQLQSFSQLQSLLQGYAAMLLSGLVLGQSPVSIIKSQYRLVAALVAAAGDEVTFSCPVTAWEEASGVVGSSITVPTAAGSSSTDRYNIIVSFINSQLLPTVPSTSTLVPSSSFELGSRIFGSYLSNAISLTADQNMLLSRGDAPILLTLQTNVPVQLQPSFYSNSSLVRKAFCSAGSREPATVQCPNDVTVSPACPGAAGAFTTTCPIWYPSLLCASVNVSLAGLGECSVLTLSPTNVTCSCTLPASARAVASGNALASNRGSYIAAAAASEDSIYRYRHHHRSSLSLQHGAVLLGGGGGADGYGGAQTGANSLIVAAAAIPVSTNVVSNTYAAAAVWKYPSLHAFMLMIKVCDPYCRVVFSALLCCRLFYYVNIQFVSSFRCIKAS